MGTCEGSVGCCVWLPIICDEMAEIELYTPQGAEMTLGMIYETDEQW